MALTLNYSEYLAFAQFQPIATIYSVGTQIEQRGGLWYDGVLKSAPQLEMNFGTDLSLTQAANVDLVIGDPAGGTYRTLVDTTNIDGAAVTITLVNRFHWNDGTVTETTYTQQLTIVGTALAPGLVTLHLQDMEDKKLAALYPSNTWKVDDFTDLSSDDAGKPICEPVGTALKFPCPLLRSDQTNNLYIYGLCTSSLTTWPVILASGNQFRVNGDFTQVVKPGSTLIVSGSTGNTMDGAYTVLAASLLAGPITRIFVSVTIPSPSTSGNLRYMAAPITVYRNRRIVSSSEYTTAIAYAYGAILNGDFASSGTNWTPTVFGTGTVTFAVGSCTIVSTGVSNRGQAQQNISVGGGTAMSGGWFAIQVTLSAGSDGTIMNSSGVRYQVPAGKTTTVFMQTLAALTGNAEFVRLAVVNDSGTAVFTKVRPVQLNYLSLIQFSTPQIDFNGTPYTIEADAAGVESRDACAEIQRLLGKAGVTADTTTFNAAIAQTFAKLVDCDYGRSGQRKFSAILDDLLFVARAGLSRTAAGAYSIWQDVSGAASITLDESIGDAVQVEKIDNPGRPASVGLNFAPSSSDANTMQVPLTRNVTGGLLGAENPREIRYLRDPTTADQLMCYLALRRQYNRVGSATLYRSQSNIGDIVAITSPRNWVGARTFTVWAIQRTVSGNKCTLMEYNAAVYTYTAATLPAIATAGYQPDYSATPPAAPTAVTVLATGTSTDGAGTTTAYVTASAVPPTVNWQTLWFAAIHNVAGLVTLVPATFTGGVYKATISGLRQGEVYKLQCYATAGTLQGAIQSTFNATAIGGGGAVTTFTTSGTAQGPAAVASCSALQSMGSYVQVSWPAISATATLQGYALERKVGAGAFTQIWRGDALNYQDSSLGYGTSLQYRVRALDVYGNFSATYATSGTVTPTANVTGGNGSGDLSSSTVDPANRTGVNTGSTTYSYGSVTNNPSGQSASFSHSLGKVPVVSCPVTTTTVNVVGSNFSTSSIAFSIIGLVQGPVNTGTGAVTYAGNSGTISANYW